MANEFIAKKGLISQGNATVVGTLSTTSDLNIGTGTDNAAIYTSNGDLILSSAGGIQLLNSPGSDITVGDAASKATITSTGNDLYLSAVGEIITQVNTSVVGILSSFGGVYDNTGNSGEWNSVHTSVNATSANWDSVVTTVNATSGNWNSVYTSVNGTSGNWNSVYTSVNGTSANWDSVVTTVNATSANWDSVVTTVNATSGNWNSVYTSVNGTSGNWNSVYTSVNGTSGNWNSVYTSYNSNSGTYQNVKRTNVFVPSGTLLYLVNVNQSSTTFIISGVDQGDVQFNLPPVTVNDIGTWYSFVKYASGTSITVSAHNARIDDSDINATIYSGSSAAALSAGQQSFASIEIELVLPAQWHVKNGRKTWTTTDWV